MTQRLWDDQEDTEVLVLLSDHFTRILADYRDIEQLALAWASTFPYEEPLQQTPAYQAVLQLHIVACDVIAKSTSLIYHLEGSPPFFTYLRTL